jgi:threonine synthase
VAGLLTLGPGELPTGGTVVVTVTGHGLKDPEWAIQGAPTPIRIAVDPGAAAKALGLD